MEVSPRRLNIPSGPDWFYSQHSYLITFSKIRVSNVGEGQRLYRRWSLSQQRATENMGRLSLASAHLDGHLCSFDLRPIRYGDLTSTA